MARFEDGRQKRKREGKKQAGREEASGKGRSKERFVCVCVNVLKNWLKNCK